MEDFRTLTDLKKRYNNQALKTKFIAQHDLTRRYLVFKNFAHFRLEYARLSCLHEVIFSHVLHKFIVDIDQKLDPDDVDLMQPILMSEVDTIKEIIIALFSMEYSEIITDANLLVIDSCGLSGEVYKFSINIVVDGFYFKNYQEFKRFGLRLTEIYSARQGSVVSDRFIDPSFYSHAEAYSQFQVRIPGHSKYGEDRPKTVKGDVFRAIVTNVEGCKKLPAKCDYQEAKRKYRALRNVTVSAETGTVLELTKHLWEHDFAFRSRDGDVFSFDRQRPSYCGFCNEIHHKDNHFYLVYFNGSIWEKCRHNKDGAKFVIAIEDNPNDQPQLLAPIPTSATHNPRLDPESMFPANKNVYLIKAHMKMGKTEECIKYINRTNPNIVVMLSFRRTFGEDMRARYDGFELYSDITGPISLVEHPRIIMQIESLNRIAYPLPDIDLVIMDETESTWSQFNHKQISDYHAVISTFQNVVGISKKMICMDADLSQRTVRLLRLIRPNFDEEHNFYKNNHNPSTGTVYSFLENRGTALAFILTQLKSGKKVVVVTNSIKTSQELNAWLSEQIETIKIGLYNSETKESKKSKHFRDVNNYWAKYDCLIYTPTITSGVSFTRHHFDILVGLFTTGSCNVETCRQMIGRVRNLADAHVYIHVQTYNRPEDVFPVLPETIRECMKYERTKLLEYAQGKYNVEQLTFDYNPSGNAEYYNNLAYHIVSENIAYDNRSRNSFVGLFIRYLTEAQFEIQRNVTFQSLGIPENVFTACDFSIKVSRSDLDKKLTTAIFEAPKINQNGAIAIKNKIKTGLDVTPEERNSMAYFRLSKQLQLEQVSERVIKIYRASGSGTSTKTRQCVACRELFDIRSKIRRDFKNLTECVNGSNHLKEANSSYSSVMHEMVAELFTEIDFGKNLVTLVTERSPMQYPPTNANTTAEHNQIRLEYWRERLPKFKKYVSNISVMSGKPRHRNLINLDGDDMLIEFRELLCKIYGLYYNEGNVFGSKDMVFEYNGARYVAGRQTEFDDDLPVIAIV